MGFYAPAQIVRDAREHGVDVCAADANASDWDSKIEGRSLRLGLRQIDGFREAWADAMLANRPFASIEDMARRACLPSRALRLLANADALRSLGFDRREGAWEARRTPTSELPLFAAARACELGEEPEAKLPAMQLGEHVAADYQTVRLSLKAHPMQILRPIFVAEGVSSCAEIAAEKNGARGKVGGIVLVRQRPGNGKAIFVTLEDETGITNIIMWARTFERFRLAVMSARLMQVEGEIQKSPEGVIHLMAHRIIDRSDVLASLSDVHRTNPQMSRADEFIHSSPPGHARTGGHPRNVRTFPKSRDFH